MENRVKRMLPEGAVCGKCHCMSHRHRDISGSLWNQVFAGLRYYSHMLVLSKSQTWWAPQVCPHHTKFYTFIDKQHEQLYKFSEAKECSLHGYLTIGRKGHLMSMISVWNVLISVAVGCSFLRCVNNTLTLNMPHGGVLEIKIQDSAMGSQLVTHWPSPSV